MYILDHRSLKLYPLGYVVNLLGNGEDRLLNFFLSLLTIWGKIDSVCFIPIDRMGRPPVNVFIPIDRMGRPPVNVFIPIANPIFLHRPFDIISNSCDQIFHG